MPPFWDTNCLSLRPRFDRLWPILVFMLTACQVTPSGQAVVDASPTAVQNVLATLPPPDMAFSTSPVLAVTASRLSPTLNPSTPAPLSTGTPAAGMTASPIQYFYNLRFAPGPEYEPQATFPAGTEEVYALWEYENLAPHDRIRRIWFRNDQIWLVREEDWDSEQYGTAGSVNDISVYDNEDSGLPPAVYRLQLYVNDSLQVEASFVIQNP